MVEKGAVSSIKEAFERYIGTHAPAYVPKYKISPLEAIHLIMEAGGVPILAHPGTFKDHEFVRELLRFPLKGIEVWHPDHTADDIAFFTELTEEYGLIKTGGSDFHGERRRDIALGDIRVEREVVEKLRELSGRR